MSENAPLRIGIIGCGRIATPYATSMAKYPERLEVIGAFDLLPEAAAAFCEQHGGRVFESMAALLACDEIEMVLNLTIHTAHAQVTMAALEAGKHVHSEKPLATNREDGELLVALAAEKGLLLGCSPFVVLGEAQQTLWKAVRDGVMGEPYEVVANILHGRIERRNPNPIPYLSPGAGPVLDVGVYPLNVATSIFGPVARVRGAAAHVVRPKRVIEEGPIAGTEFTVTTPDHVTALMEFEGGLPLRFSASFTVDDKDLPGICVYGAKGTLKMGVSFLFNAPVTFRPEGADQAEPVPYVATPRPGVDWATGALDMQAALRTGSPLHCTGKQALHILDVCLSILEAGEEGRPQEVTSRFERPSPVYA